MAEQRDKVAIIGSGIIGKSWALLFSSAGFRVSLHDNDPAQLGNVLAILKDQLETLASQGLSRGDLQPEAQVQKVTVTGDLAACVKDATIIVESVSENLEVKRRVLSEADGLMTHTAILASSTSHFLPSTLSADLTHRHRFLVTHPVNPPFYARAVELVPAPWTGPEVMQQAGDVMRLLGQAPIVMKKEIQGFVLNRMQFAIMAESWRLLKDGVLGVDGINKAVWAGLGPRYAFLGPFQVGHLNAAGMGNYLERYGPTILRLQSSMGEAGRMGGQLAEVVQDTIEKISPHMDVLQRRRWRELRMARLAQLKNRLEREEQQEVEQGKRISLPSDH